MSLQKHDGRRRFLQRAASSAMLSALPLRAALGQIAPGMRLEWQAFRTTTGYASFIDAIGRMRANPDGNDPNSLAYWANIHAQYCPHNTPYFMAWHRGYVTLFERQLQALSGNGNLMLPYWNFYQTPMLPWEFTDAASGNPLYSARANGNIRDALTLAPFDAAVFNFQRGSANAFEPLLEYAPHDASHNLIGGRMLTMQAPMDPIFWIFHCNIDRLWHAWAYPNGKAMPWVTDDYWSGVHRYGPALMLARDLTWHPSRLGYDYSDISAPSVLPPVAAAAKALRVQARASDMRPPLATLPACAPRAISASAKSLGGVRKFALREHSLSARIRLDAAQRRALRSVRNGQDAAPLAQGDGQYRSLHLVLEDIGLINLGSFGGFYYQLYLNLPESGTASHRHFLGTLGAFEIAAASHHGKAGLRFAASEVLARLDPAQLDELTISFVRVNGANYPKGEALAVGELRFEISKEDAWDRRRPARMPPDRCYC
jgi:tyrosinase